MSIIGAVTAGAGVAKGLGVKFPKINLGFGTNGKKKAKDEIKKQMKQLGVKESSIKGFSWRNANAGKELLEYLIANPSAVASYNANPVSDIGGQSVKEWIEWNKRTNPGMSGARGGGATSKETAPVMQSTARGGAGGVSPKMAGYVLAGILLLYGFGKLAGNK